MNCRLLYIIALIALITQGLASCTMCNRSGDFHIPEFGERDSTELQIDESVMVRMVDNIGSPIEVASLMQALELPFTQRYLAGTRNVSNFHTSHEKAFNLGVLGCDLGYLNMYGRVSLVLEYIAAIRTLANGINVGQFFDFTTLRRLATNNENVDSLVHISQMSFNRIDRYLQQNNRGNLSVLMVTGVWIEGLYLTSQFYRERPDERRLGESIAEQKMMLMELMILLNNFSRERYIANLLTELETIKVLFDDIKITIEPGEPQMIEVDGMLRIIQTDNSIVEYSDELMASIIDQIEIVRNKLIQ